jgi:hypothetical protein
VITQRNPTVDDDDDEEAENPADDEVE